MSTTKIALSSAQREALQFAADRDGQLPRFCTITTQRILEDRGLIIRDVEYRDGAARENKTAVREEFIAIAKEMLQSDNWVRARIALAMAQDAQNDLDRTCYWITDAGREAVKP